MTGEPVDAQDIIDTMYDIEDEIIGTYTMGYCRDVDYKGDESYHHFIAYGNDILGEAWIQGFADLIDVYQPDRVELATTSSHPHLIIGFKDERMRNSPPEPKGKFDSLDVYPRDGECERCSRSTPDAYPELTIRTYDGENKWDGHTEETIDLCVHCSSAHFDDITRQTNAICVEDSQVVAVEYGNGNVIPVDSPEFKDSIVEDLIKILERDILSD